MIADIDGARRPLHLEPALLGALPALALFVAWAADDGGYAPTTWYPGTLAVLFLLVAIVGGLGVARGSLSRPLAAALAALAAYTAWSFASVAWADAAGTALEGSNRTLLYLLVAAVFAVLPWTVAALRGALLGYVLAMGALAVITVLRVKGAEDPLGFFANARLTAPLGYQNASPAAWTMSALPAVLLASRRDTATALRPVLLGLATLLCTLGLASQSRTWLATLPVLVLLGLLLTPSRVRFALAAAPVAVATFLARGPLLEIYDRGGISRGDVRSDAEIARVLGAAFDDAAAAMFAAALTVAAVGLVWALADRRVELSERARALVRRAGAVAAAVGVVLALAGAIVASDGDPVGKLDEAVEEFKAGADPGEDSGTRFGSLGSSRYDFWRVSWDLFAEHPLRGLGQDNFAAEYLPRSRSDETPRWTHSLELRLLTHTGLVGFLLFAAVVAALALALWRARTRLSEPGRAVLAAAALPGAVWLLAGSVDWFWEFPALSAPALAFAFAAGRLVPGPESSAGWPRWALVTAGGAVVACVIVIGAPWLAVRHADRALEVLPDVGAATDHLERARGLDPFSTRPSMLLGLIAARIGDDQAAAGHFRDVLARQSRNWAAELRLGTVLAARDRAAAEEPLERARSLNPGSSLVRDALEGLRRGRPLSMDDINGRLAEAEKRLTAR